MIYGLHSLLYDQLTELTMFGKWFHFTTCNYIDVQNTSVNLSIYVHRYIYTQLGKFVRAEHDLGTNAKGPSSPTKRGDQRRKKDSVVRVRIAHSSRSFRCASLLLLSSLSRPLQTRLTGPTISTTHQCCQAVEPATEIKANQGARSLRLVLRVFA